MIASYLDWKISRNAIEALNTQFKKMMSSPSLIRLLILAALWGGSFLFMRIVTPEFGTNGTAFGRASLGASGLAALVLVMRIPLDFKGRFMTTLMLGAINSGMPFLLFSWASRSLPTSYSAILNATTPLMGVVVGSLAFGERVTTTKILGVVLGIAGVAVLTGGASLGGISSAAGSVLACLLATTCYALAGFLTVRWIAKRGGLDSHLVALGSQIGAVLLLVPSTLWQFAQEPVALHQFSVTAWWSLFALGFLCTSLGYVLYFRLIADLGALRALTVTFLIPLFGLFWGWLVLDEPVGLAHVIGGGLIATALYFVLRSPISPTQRST